MNRLLLTAASVLALAAPVHAAQETHDHGDHSGHDMPMAQEAEDPHAGHDMSGAAPDPHAGHAMPEAATDPHAGHHMSGSSPEIAVGAPPAEASQGPAHAADLFFDPAAMQASRDALSDHGGMTFHRLVVDRAELRFHDGKTGYALDADFWIGKDIDKLWIKAEAEGEFGEAAESIEVQALWSHAIGPFFDLQAGVRHDPVKGEDRTHLVLGIMGLAPYWFEVDAAAFLSNKGELTARLEGEYDLRITNRLILQPRVELGLSAQKVPERGIGSGLTNAEAGLRLRYEVTPQLAPYVGIEVERAFGSTASYRRADGEKRGGISVLTGIRMSF